MPESNVYGNVGVPRIYVDYFSYAKAIGMVGDPTGDGYSSWNLTGGIDLANAYDFNPTKLTGYIMGVGVTDGDPFTIRVKFKNYGTDTQAGKSMLQFENFLSTINYAGCLGHKFGLENVRKVSCGAYKYLDVDGTITHSGDTININGNPIVGDATNTNSLGYFLHEINMNNELLYPDRLGSFEFRFYPPTDNAFAEGSVVHLGTLTAGRYFDLPHNADVDVSLGFDFSGITRNKTASGDILTQINYKRPKWGDLRAWTNIDLTPYHEQGIDPKQALLDQDYSTTGLQGRRSWNLSFSYISKDDMFPKNFDGNMSGNYEATTSTFTWDEDSSIVSSSANATLGFQLPFILQPDKNKQDFAIVKAKANSIKVSQQAPMLYKFSITLIEQY